MFERANHELAFERLVRLHRSKVYGLALRMMRDSGEAEEVAQETFLSAWQHLATFRGESAMGSWLYRICANACLMRLRRGRLETGIAEQTKDLPGPQFDTEGSLISSPSPDWTATSAEEQVLNDELRQAIEGASAELPDDHRAVFLLKDVDGLSYTEIAEAIGSTVPAVKSRLHRARLALREAIDAFYRQPGASCQAA